jgi:CRP/FNR family transcriptional regulator
MGREITLYEMGAGDICLLNVSCLLSNTTLPANASSLTKVEMLLMSAGDFHNLMNKYEEMRNFVFNRIACGFTSVMTLLTEVTFGKLDERLSNYLIEKSENGKLSTTHQKIANDLGTSREVISRLLKHYQEQGQVQLSRNLIEITDL